MTHPLAITGETITGAQILQDAAPEIVFLTEVAMASRGVDDPSETIAALLTAAWTHHKEIAGLSKNAAFSTLLRDMADSVDRLASLN